MNKWFKLVIAIAVPLIAGWVGSLVTAPKIDTWYATLAKPALNPPDWVFAPVWTALFILMGFALWLVWSEKTKDERQKRKAMIAFSIQLVLNVLWSVSFFGEQSPILALAVIVALWIMILITILRFAQISRATTWFLLPYILWVSFAGYLNFLIWQLNRL